MKKFLVYLLILIGAVSIGFGTYMVVENKEAFAFVSTTKYVTVGEEFAIEYSWTQRKSDLKIGITDSSVVEYNASANKFVAKKGGITYVTFVLENAITNRNNSIQIFVGDGSLLTPFYISSAEQLSAIGHNDLYTLDKSYKLINKIDLNTSLATQYWLPIANNSAEGFVGNFDGNGYEIQNININEELYNSTYDTNYSFTNVGLFSKIGVLGKVANVKIDNLLVIGSEYKNVGAIAGLNYGTIERVEVRTATFNVDKVETLGGVVGLNESLEHNTDDEDAYSRTIARVDRASANVLIGANIEVSSTGGELILKNGVDGTVGGLIGKNYGGVVVYSYSMGKAYINDLTDYYGGLIGVNEYKGFIEHDSYKYSHTGAHVKDTYTTITLYDELTSSANTTVMGGLIGYNKDLSLTEGGNSVVNKIIGNYYNFTTFTQYTQDSNAVGVKLYVQDGEVLPYIDEQFIVVGGTNNNLKNQNFYVSYQDNADNVISWKFNSIWQISSSNNNGYPYLNYANVESSDDIQKIKTGADIDSLIQLRYMKLDEYREITADIFFSDLGDEVETWIPIGTKTKPFIGTLVGKVVDGVMPVIGDLIIDGDLAEDNTYGGLFGVIGEGASISNIRLDNIKITNYKYAGAVAGSNGLKNLLGGTISNVEIVGSSISGINSVGAVVGENFGIISNVSVEDFVGDFGMTRGNVVKLLPSDSGDYNVGGIVGINYSQIIDSMISGDVSVIASQIDDENPSSYSANVGGAAGYNLGSIKNVKIYAIKIASEKSISGYVGGIAGVNESEIDSVFAQSEISGDKDRVDSYVAGIIGHLTGNGTLRNAMVKGAGIIGYNAAGAIGKLNYSREGYRTKFEFESNGNIKLNNGNFVAVQYVGAQDVAITGEIIGGLVGTFENGIISDAYAITSQTGLSGSSEKSGLVANMPYSGSGNNVLTGVIQKAYNSTSFQGNGKNYAVSKSEFLKEPSGIINFITGLVVGFTQSRPSGYVLNYLFDDDVDGNAEKPASSDWLKDVSNALLRYDKYSPSTTGEMKSSSKYIDFTFNGADWEFGGNYPRLKTLISLNYYG